MSGFRPSARRVFARPVLMRVAPIGLLALFAASGCVLEVEEEEPVRRERVGDVQMEFGEAEPAGDHETVTATEKETPRRPGPETGTDQGDLPDLGEIGEPDPQPWAPEGDSGG